jgi:predicted amidohydrolase
MTRRLRIGVMQFELRPERNLGTFLAHVERVVDNAARAGAELIVFPEHVTTGLLASHHDAEHLQRHQMRAIYLQLFPELTEGFVDAVRSFAKKKGLWILAGSHFRRTADGIHVNTGYLAHPSGTVESQDKLHLTPGEVAIETAPGNDLLITTVGPARVAVQICADIEFPEVSRHLALQGVDLILCPSLTWNRRGANRVRYSCLARSLENQLFVALSPLIGSCGIPTDGAIHGTGRAMISCPLDRVFGTHDGVLAQAQGDGEEVVIADLNLDLIGESRESPEPPGLKNLRPELYRRFGASGGAT